MNEKRAYTRIASPELITSCWFEEKNLEQQKLQIKEISLSGMQIFLPHCHYLFEENKSYSIILKSNDGKEIAAYFVVVWIKLQHDGILLGGYFENVLSGDDDLI